MLARRHAAELRRASPASLESAPALACRRRRTCEQKAQGRDFQQLRGLTGAALWLISSLCGPGVEARAGCAREAM